MTGRRISGALLGCLLLAGVAGCEGGGSASTDAATSGAAAERHAAAPTHSPESTSRATPSRARAATDPNPLLRPATGGDGDSWRDTAGREYRLGLINTPETNECFGAAATAKRKELTRPGFRAQVYATDTHGRSVAVVTTATGINLNVYLARHGFADDRYLNRFRSQNPRLAAALDSAFASAKAERAGLWGACAAGSSAHAFAAPAPAAPQRAAGSCHPDYITCIPIKGDGSGAGEANDLDCGDINQTVRLRQIGVDPYRLDGNHDGYGCE